MLDYQASSFSVNHRKHELLLEKKEIHLRSSIWYVRKFFEKVSFLTLAILAILHQGHLGTFFPAHEILQSCKPLLCRILFFIFCHLIFFYYDLDFCFLILRRIYTCILISYLFLSFYLLSFTFVSSFLLLLSLFVFLLLFYYYFYLCSFFIFF